MPTPSRTREQSAIQTHYSSCPLEDEYYSPGNTGMDARDDGTSPFPNVFQQPTPPVDIQENSMNTHKEDQTQEFTDDENTSLEKQSPKIFESQNLVNEGLDRPVVGLNSPLITYDFSYIRLIQTSSSSFLRPGSRFKGTQQSERQVYDVQVEIKYVDMRESFLCGYLRIQGLTEDHPTLTTYFEGEIIGSKYTFLTQHQDWGSNDKVDLTHWAKFSSFRPFSKKAKKGKLTIPHLTQRENIFMRWKEHFLVPDHRVRTISGASFEGFYYICFNQIHGTVSGIYFHAKSEKFQQLELKHVEDRGCFVAMEFR
ncbi:Glucose-induced degradation protein 4 [Erysiphe necator]|uniref:Putative vacuolar import and degradation protein n=1 Tax=Uncinula necator TaxID=52586 RepID=A0A0B1P953_UNCNE|nr:Glucose-induced degradation protein 4 [Erysiphe necator]KHJ34763.1 putative vacuolar import and degradation protein [Erysiphe necator]